MRRVLYLGWIGFNNLGDEWMWREFEHLRRRHLNPQQYEIVPSLPGVNINDVSSFDSIVLGGGSQLIQGYVDLLYSALLEGKKVIIWGSGYDQMMKPGISPDGGLFLNPAYESKDYLGRLQEVIGRSAFCAVRGPWTYEYLQVRDVPMDRVVLSGDPALMAAGEKSEDMRSDRRRIAVNWGTSYGKIYGGDEEAVEQELAEACRQLVAQGYKLYLYAVWGPDRQAVKRLYNRIADPESVVFESEVFTLEEWLSRMQQFDAAINLKLHANVLSAVSHIPFVCLAYRFGAAGVSFSSGRVLTAYPYRN